MNKYISSGGLGDAFIVSLKLTQLRQKDMHWTHVESNDVVPKLCKELFVIENNEFLCDPDYIENYKKGKWSGHIPLSSGIDSWCPLKGETHIKLENPFLDVAQDIEKSYDAVIQVSAGAKNGRSWRFDPIQLQKLMKAKGLNVALVGTDERFKKEDEGNFVGKLSINETLALLRKSNTFIGLSGFLSFWAMSNKINTIHYQIDEEHNKRYLHPLWAPYCKNIEIGSISEVLRSLK